MVLKYASQIAALNAEIAELDADLVSDPLWQALTQKKISAPARGTSSDAPFAQLRLEQELARNPVYRARVKLLEAVQILQQLSATGELQESNGQVEAQAVPPVIPDAQDVSTATESLSSTQETSVSAQDDLMRIRGITRSLNERLTTLGVTRFKQIAEWTNEDRQAMSAQLGLDREISRQNWIAQAALLVAKSASETPTPEKSKATPETTSECKQQAQPIPALGSVQTSASLQMEAASPPPPQDKAPPRDVPHVLITSAAQGVIRRLQAQNDAGPSQVAETSGPNLPSVPAMPVAKSLHPQSQIIFSPQLMPEPRRVLAEQVRHQKRPDGLKAPTQAPARSTMHEDARKKTVAQPNAETGTFPRATKQVLPKDKLRFRRLKVKSQQPSQATAGVVPPLTQTSETVDALDNGLSSNPLSPPPVPTQPKNAGAFKKRRWLRQRAHGVSPAGGRPRFGDGQTWRQPDPVLTGPVLNDDVGMDSNIYAHTEEASVEIVRPRSNTAAPRDPLDVPSRTPSKPNSEAGQTEKPVESVRSHPAKRIFGALRRE